MSRVRLVLAVAASSTALLLAGCASGSSAVDSTPAAGGGSIPVASAPASDGALPELSSSAGALSVTLTAAESQVPYNGSTRWAMTYNGQVSGPTLRVRAGDTLRITLVNHLDQPTSLHTHGLHVSPEQDDPFTMVEPGQSRTYEYTIPKDQQAGTFWYHPHVHTTTAEQVASGLSGAIIVENATDDALARVTTDRTLVINDPPLVQSNPWRDSRGASSAAPDHGSMMGDSSGGGMDSMMGMDGSGVDMMTAMVGRTGPRLLTNGRDGVALTGSSGRLERTHIVNATASTTLTLTYSGARMVELATTGGRLPRPQDAAAITLAPGERTEVVLVPSAQGGKLMAQRHSNEGAAGLTGLPELIATTAADAGTDTSLLPTTMEANSRDLFAPDVVVARQRVVTLDGHMNPTIDGRPFDAGRIDLTAAKGTVEEWVIRSNSPMAHPIHLHTWPFQVRGQEGWTDVVSVPANGEQVIRVAFDDFAGTTVLHCHILDHEDTGMMATIKVE